MSSRSSIRALVAVAAILLMSLCLVTSPASGQSGDAPNYLAKINALRASVGVAPLQVDANLNALAQSWAQQLASQGRLADASDLSAGVTSSWNKLGENVGVGPNTDTVFNAFIGSAGHYANLVDPAFTHIGIGVVWVGNTQYTAHRFMAAGGPQSAPPPAPQYLPAPPSGGGSNDGTADDDSAGAGATPTTSPVAPEPAPTPIAAPPATPERIGAIVDAFRAIPT